MDTESELFKTYYDEIVEDLHTDAINVLDKMHSHENTRMKWAVRRIRHKRELEFLETKLKNFFKDVRTREAQKLQGVTLAKFEQSVKATPEYKELIKEVREMSEVVDLLQEAVESMKSKGYIYKSIVQENVFEGGGM